MNVRLTRVAARVFIDVETRSRVTATSSDIAAHAPARIRTEVDGKAAAEVKAAARAK